MHITPLFPLFSTMNGKKASVNSKQQAPTPAKHPQNALERASLIQHQYGNVLHKMEAICHHPRSLARAQANWRPPRVSLPADAQEEQLCATISRRRIGNRALSYLKNVHGTSNTASYVVSLRFSNPRSHHYDQTQAEAWVRAFIGNGSIECVHFIPEATSVTFIWLVDHHFNPISSPAEMFMNYPAAA